MGGTFMKFLDRDSYLIDFIGIYFLIICAFFTILRDMDIYYMYLILVIINGVVALFAYIISVVTLSTAQEKIYKDLARIFGIVAVLKILFAIYVFDNLGHSTLNQEVQNQEVQMTVLNLAIQTILYTSFIYVYVNKKKNNIFNNVIHMIMILIPIMYILITWTNILPNMYVGGRYSIVKNMSANSVMLEDTLEEIIISVSVITIFSTALMVYSMLNYIKKRIADYSLFYILGMKKQKLYVFVFSEYLAGWMVSLLIGLGIGRGILYLIQQIWHKLFPTYISLCSVGKEIYFNTCKISFFIMLAVVFVLLIWADNSGISRMIAGNEIKEKRPKSIYWSICIVIGGGLLILGYWSYPSNTFTGYVLSHVEWIMGGFLILIFGGGILLEIIHSHLKFYLKNLLKLNQLYSKYQTNVLVLLMFLSLHFIALSYCTANVCELLPINGHEKYYPYQAIWMNRGEKGDISFSETLSHSYNGKYENIPMIRVSSYGNELIGISENTYKKLTGKSADLKNEEIIYIVNEYKNHSGANVTRGGFEYGRNGFTWLAMGSYINELKKYVDPSSNHPLPNHDTDHLYKIRETVTGNLFGYYKMNDQAENVVVFSNKYFSRQYKILSKKEYEPNTLTLFAFPNESKEKATAKIKKYAKIHGPNDFELTDTPQSTLYITDEFLKTVKKGDIFKITNKIFIIIALLISSIFVSAIKAASDLQYYRKEKEFLQCMGIHEKIWKKIFDVEIQILSWISLITATILSAAYMIMNIHIESERGVIYGYKIWIYWLVILCLYWFMHYILQRIVTRYARKNVERQEKRK